MHNKPTINPNDVEIVRDKWGVPHIFGNTDAEAFLWFSVANAEDAFAEMQDLLIVGKKMKGKQEGIDGAKADFFANVIRATEIVERDYNTLPQDFKIFRWL
ncbi:MAG: penicillin acylase family protein [Chitinophagales bacterium]